MIFLGRIKQLLCLENFVFILTEDKKLNVYKLTFYHEKIQHSRIEENDLAGIQGIFFFIVE